MKAIDKADGRFRFPLDEALVSSDRLVSTIPLHRAEALCGMSSEEELETITLLSLYFSFSGKRGFAQPILYNFSHEGGWKRITVYSDFYGRVDDREYFTAEVIANHVGHSAELAEDDFRKHVSANGLFDGDLRLEGSQMLENAYPIYSNGAEQRAARAIRALKDFGIESFGRQGGFNYQPTARVSTHEAEAALQVRQL
jgi:protoporphyrinogen oxidase